jgi:phospholipase C
MGSIADVKHVVILMLENRSFDEYFGTFPGAPVSTTQPNSLKINMAAGFCHTG